MRCWCRASTWSRSRTCRPGSRDGFLAAAQRLATAVVEGLGAQGSFVAMNNVVSQSVPHLHCHVVPRTKGDGLRGFFWPRTKYRDGEAATYAARLRRRSDDPRRLGSTATLWPGEAVPWVDLRLARVTRTS